jgi:cytochrome c oxidase cbb3-type subunit 3
VSPRLIFFAAAIGAALMMAACDREERKLSHESTPGELTPTTPRVSEIQPGGAGPGLTETQNTRSFDGHNAWEMAQGQRLFGWYNCAACHGRGGGGGMGPALSDDRWLYGDKPDEIFKTVMEGRPNGMPSFRGRIPEDQVWQLVAYIRSMSGLAATNAAPSRSDSTGGLYPPENERPTAKPYTKPEPQP